MTHCVGAGDAEHFSGWKRNKTPYRYFWVFRAYDCLYRFDVCVVLPQRVVELLFVAVDYLRPVLLLCVPKDPTRIRFCFYAKNAEVRYHDMIYLCCVRITTRWKHEIVEHFVMLRVEFKEITRHKVLAPLTYSKRTTFPDQEESADPYTDRQNDKGCHVRKKLT